MIMIVSMRCAVLARSAVRFFVAVVVIAVLMPPSSFSVRALGQFLVMDAVGLPMKPGQEIDLTHPLTLKAGEKLSLIGYNGFILNFVGPTTVTAAQVANPYAGKFFDPLRALADRLEKSGTLRSARAPGRTIDNPWHIDVSHPGQRCVLEKSQVMVWRDSVAPNQTLVIGPAGSSWFASLDWPNDSALMALGGEVRFDNDERVVVELDGVMNELTMHVIPRSVSTPAAQAAWMIQKGCEDQAVVIVRGLIGH